VLLDFTGGTLSVAQLLMQCIVLRDWMLIAGNPVKFGLGFVALAFDIVFMLQHYVWFRVPEGQVAVVSERQQLVEVVPSQDAQQPAPLVQDATGDVDQDAQ
jgi:hypothetical protein